MDGICCCDMGIVDVLTTASGVIVALGGWKVVEALIFRKSKGKLLSAEASEAEYDARKAKTSADEAHFDLLYKQLNISEERNLRLQEDLAAKESRFQEQTALLRKTNADLRKADADLLEAARTIGARDKRIAELEAERKMRLCERKGCKRREPQSGY